MLDNHCKIFVVGFPKCGTTSLHEAFLQNNISSIHWAEDADFLISLVGISIRQAKLEGLPFLTYLKDYSAFAQMESCINEHLCYWPQLVDVPALDSQYPNSKFIFNDRNLSNWLKSVDHWTIPSCGRLRQRLTDLDIPGLPPGKGGDDEDLKSWYLWHKNNMLDYFKNKDNFMVFDIENDHGQKLGDFLCINNFKIPHANRSNVDAS